MEKTDPHLEACNSFFSITLWSKYIAQKYLFYADIEQQVFGKGSSDLNIEKVDNFFAYIYQ